MWEMLDLVRMCVYFLGDIAFSADIEPHSLSFLAVIPNRGVRHQIIPHPLFYGGEDAALRISVMRYTKR